MALKPTDLPIWNSTEERVTQPDTTRQTTGWIWSGTKFEKPKGEHFNWLLNSQYKWIKYFDERLQLDNSGFSATLQSGTLTENIDLTLPTAAGKIMSENINALTAKTTTVDADELAIADSASSFSLKKLTWANIKATLKTYFDTLYAKFQPTIATGSATFTNSTNNIALTGVGIGVEIGDVIQVSGSTNNDTEFTVEVITDANNVIVNQAHAGGTTTKALVNETATVTVKLLAKWYDASDGLGQDWVDVTAIRLKQVNYPSQPNRTIMASLTATSNSVQQIFINGSLFGQFTGDSSFGNLQLDVTKGNVYKVEPAGGAIAQWWERR